VGETCQADLKLILKNKSEGCFEKPKKLNGMDSCKNVYAPTKEECEEKLQALIVEMKNATQSSQ